MVIKEKTDSVSLTPAACQAVRDLLVERKLEGYSLRVYVSGRTCAGLQYGMALDNNPRETDLTFDTDGVSVLIDDQSILFMHGATIDFIDDARGKGFLVNNPNQVSACGSCESTGCESC